MWLSGERALQAGEQQVQKPWNKMPGQWCWHANNWEVWLIKQSVPTPPADHHSYTVLRTLLWTRPASGDFSTELRTTPLPFLHLWLLKYLLLFWGSKCGQGQPVRDLLMVLRKGLRQLQPSPDSSLYFAKHSVGLWYWEKWSQPLLELDLKADLRKESCRDLSGESAWSKS